MTAFYDDFNRANGGLGDDWTTANGTPTISGGYAVGVGETYAVCDPVEDTDYQEVICSVGFVTGQTGTSGPLIKAQATGRAGYWAWFYFSSPNWYFAIFRRDASANTVIASTVYPTAPPFLSTVRIVWNLGTITATVDGGSQISVEDSTYALNTRMGMRLQSSAMPIADFRAFGTATAALAVDPDVIGNYGACTELTLTGTGTAWTTGTPGSPTFTVDHGSISAQEVTSSTTATITYCPGDYLGSVVFTDPSTGMTDGAVVTSDPTIVPPGDLCPFDPDFIDLANRTGDLPGDGYLLRTDQEITVPNHELTVIEVMRDLWAALVIGGVTPEAGSFLAMLDTLRRGTVGAWELDEQAFFPTNEQPIKADTDDILNRVNTLTSQYTDLADVVGILGGSPTVLSHQDLKTAIDGVSAQIDLQPILDALTALRGTANPSLTDITEMLQQLSTIAGYNLGDVLAAIAAIPSGDNSGQITASTAAILGAIAALALEVAGVAAGVTADNAQDASQLIALAGLAASLAGAVASILDAINQVRDLVGGPAAARVPPIWPGVAHVTFGAVSDLATVTNVDGPMHGVEVEITATEPGTSFMQYDGVKAWRHVGGLVFYNDRGMCETYQALGFGRAMYVPKTMAVAQGVKLFKSHLPQGTVTPWTITS